MLILMALLWSIEYKISECFSILTKNKEFYIYFVLNAEQLVGTFKFRIIDYY